MKFFRFGPAGAEKPGAVDASGVHRDISSLVNDIEPRTIASGEVLQLKADDLIGLPEIPAGSRLGPCIAWTGHFIGIGLNYLQHAIETNSPIPTEPIVFHKAPSCLTGPTDDVILPRGSVKTDWEVELAFVMAKEAHYVSEDEALDLVLGYCVCNDVSEREIQLERGGQWGKGKSAPTFGPIGPYLVTPEDIPDPQNLGLWLEVNGKRVQESNTSDMIFSVARIISYLSECMRLLPGDLITTGTPPGVGLGMQPNVFLKRGDVMRLGVEGLGVQEQKVV